MSTSGGFRKPTIDKQGLCMGSVNLLVVRKNRTNLHVSLDIHHQQRVPLPGAISPLVMIMFMAETVVTGITLSAVLCILFYRYYVSRQI